MKPIAFEIDAGVDVSRRSWLRRLGAVALCRQASMPLTLLAGASVAAQDRHDHKALVCVYLAGGNDQSNTVVPLDATAYNAYAGARPELALPMGHLLPLSWRSPNHPALGLHPSLSALHPWFEQGAGTVLANVGTLVQPITQAQWNRGSPSVAVPQQLFSHSDQTGAWHTGLPDRPSRTGWLGRTADALAAAYAPASGVSMSMSVAGNALLMSGSGTVQYQLTPQGAVAVTALSRLYGRTEGAQALRQLMTEPRGHTLENELTRISARAVAAEGTVRAATSGVVLPVSFPTTPLGQQLQMVARLIASQGALGQRRQLFFVQQGGYDFHDDLLTDQAARLKELGDALAAFQATMVALGVSRQVTAFTASDFGRALGSNGRGSDHGWGSHHLVVGGAVAGGRLHGQWPTVALNGPEDAGRGRLIPSTSVDEYAATLVRWLGVAPSDLPRLLPNLPRFGAGDLGFLRA